MDERILADHEGVYASRSARVLCSFRHRPPSPRCRRAAPEELAAFGLPKTSENPRVRPIHGHPVIHREDGDPHDSPTATMSGVISRSSPWAVRSSRACPVLRIHRERRKTPGTDRSPETIHSLAGLPVAPAIPRDLVRDVFPSAASQDHRDPDIHGKRRGRTLRAPRAHPHAPAQLWQVRTAGSPPVP